jgi:hypothetical protein
MLFFLKLNNRHCGKMLTATSVQSCDDRKCGNNTETKHRQIQEPNPGKAFLLMCRLLALFLALAVASTVVLAGEGGNDNDLTGSWFVKNTLVVPGGPPPPPFFSLSTFTKDGNFIGATPSIVSHPTTPGFGVWQRTGGRTFALTFRSIESDSDANAIGFIEVRQTIMLNHSGDTWDGTAVLVERDPNTGNIQPPTPITVTMHAERIVVNPL